jgi:hypothetical protein
MELTIEEVLEKLGKYIRYGYEDINSLNISPISTGLGCVEFIVSLSYRTVYPSKDEDEVVLKSIGKDISVCLREVLRKMEKFQEIYQKEE